MYTWCVNILTSALAITLMNMHYWLCLNMKPWAVNCCWKKMWHLESTRTWNNSIPQVQMMLLGSRFLMHFPAEIMFHSGTNILPLDICVYVNFWLRISSLPVVWMSRKAEHNLNVLSNPKLVESGVQILNIPVHWRSHEVKGFLLSFVHNILNLAVY